MVVGLLLGALGAYVLGTAAKSAYDAMKDGEMERDLKEDPFSWGLVGQIYLMKKEIDKLSRSTSIKSEEHEAYEQKIRPSYIYRLPSYHHPTYTTRSYTKPVTQTYSRPSYKPKQTSTDPLEELIKKLVRS